ncbi:Tyrosyl-DNA phosphodiesterase [Teratosphaeria destructans]|uniref:Tyrosyl-DNA phosphodiesterase n=1 Tax=Teratosphaeria destructans TaxID=418781 RepID=A0A9W7T0P3_9PEZI|nr:Tyrosyl-DNA phosphodiesterase [Teratosphaeria destructans]
MSSSDSDEELKAAIALSLSETKNAVSDQVIAKDVPTKPSGGLAGLDRRAMERERLVRQAHRKRDRSISPPSPRGSRKAPKLETTTVELPSGARLNSLPIPLSVPSSQDSRISASIPSGLTYPNGIVKKTWAFGHPRTGNDIKLEEVLEPASLRTAVLSAFQWDKDWLLPKLKTPLNGGSTKCIFVMQAKGDDMRAEMRKQTEGMPFLRLCFPPMDGQINCMHSKLMLLFHPHKLRVAIPTANLLNFDWGETGQMENSVFMIDLPRLPADTDRELDHLTDFGRELMFFIEKQGLDEEVRKGVLNFDFSATSNIAFVHTTGGALYRDEASRTGYPGLALAVRRLGLQTDSTEVDFAASSIGSLNDDYLRAIHSAVKGEDALALSSAAATKPKTDFFNKPDKKTSTNPLDIRKALRIYFPTHDTVASSTAGAAGTICISRKWWENMSFPRPVFRDYISLRPGLLSHNKVLYARGKRRLYDSEEKTEDVAWAYVGSANMSESAWGKLVYDRKEKAWKINCRNWECGVLLPVPKETLEAARRDGEVVGMEVFENVVPRPFEYPGTPFGEREPWYFQEQN